MKEQDGYAFGVWGWGGGWGCGWSRPPRRMTLIADDCGFAQQVGAVLASFIDAQTLQAVATKFQ
jgi:hypothetical protein